VRLTKIAPIGELGDVFPHVLCRNVDMSSAYRTLEMTPMTFNRVRVVDASNPLLFAVIDATNIETEF
jgi:hypothetical protein